MTGLIPQSLYDELRVESETYRAAWLKAEREREHWYAEAKRLARELGKEGVYYEGDICRVAGVERTTLAQWVRRYREGTAQPFPRPLPGTHPREWDARSVDAWLRETGRVTGEGA